MVTVGVKGLTEWTLAMALPWRPRSKHCQWYYYYYYYYYCS